MREVRRSLRWRIQLWHGLLLLAVLMGFGFTAYRLQAVNEYRRLDAELSQRASLLTRALNQNAEEDRPPLRPRGRSVHRLPVVERMDFHRSFASASEGLRLQEAFAWQASRTTPSSVSAARAFITSSGAAMEE